MRGAPPHPFVGLLKSLHYLRPTLVLSLPEPPVLAIPFLSSESDLPLQLRLTFEVIQGIGSLDTRLVTTLRIGVLLA